MPRNADNDGLPRTRGVSPPPRFELDRTWLLRGILAALAIALVMLVAKVSMMAVGGGNKRLERLDPSNGTEAAAAVRAKDDAASH